MEQINPSMVRLAIQDTLVAQEAIILPMVARETTIPAVIMGITILVTEIMGGTIPCTEFEETTMPRMEVKGATMPRMEVKGATMPRMEARETTMPHMATQVGDIEAHQREDTEAASMDLFKAVEGTAAEIAKDSGMGVGGIKVERVRSAVSAWRACPNV
jgi:hypothetical protein